MAISFKSFVKLIVLLLELIALLLSFALCIHIAITAFFHNEDAGPPFTNCHSNIDSNKLRGEPHSGTQSRELLLESPRFPL